MRPDAIAVSYTDESTTAMYHLELKGHRNEEDARAAAALATAEFSAYYKDFAPRLGAWLIWQGVSREDAWDIVNETMIEVHRRWQSITHPQTYARRVASRRFAERIGRGEADLVGDFSDFEIAAPAGDIDASEAALDVHRALARLPLRQRQVLAWSAAEYTPTEIAEQLRMTPGAVRSNLSKARARLSELLGDQGADQ